MQNYNLKINQWGAIEVYFDEKPNNDILTRLKESGFKWFKKNLCWSAFKSEEETKAILNNEKIEKSEITTKEKINKYGVKVGDIFVNSWGYDQTNVEFYQVVEIMGACKIRLKEIRQQTTRGIGGMSCYVKPIKNAFLEKSYFMNYENNKMQENNNYIKIVQLGYDNKPYIKLGKSYNAYLCSENSEHYCSWYA